MSKKSRKISSRCRWRPGGGFLGGGRVGSRYGHGVLGAGRGRSPDDHGVVGSGGRGSSSRLRRAVEATGLPHHRQEGGAPKQDDSADDASDDGAHVVPRI